MKTIVISWICLALLICRVLAGDDDDPGPEPDDDPEGDCMKFHNCYGRSQWGYCVERKGHSGLHLCTKCLTYFSDDE